VPDGTTRSSDGGNTATATDSGGGGCETLQHRQRHQWRKFHIPHEQHYFPNQLESAQTIL